MRTAAVLSHLQNIATSERDMFGQRQATEAPPNTTPCMMKFQLPAIERNRKKYGNEWECNQRWSFRLCEEHDLTIAVCLKAQNTIRCYFKFNT